MYVERGGLNMGFGAEFFKRGAVSLVALDLCVHPFFVNTIFSILNREETDFCVTIQRIA